MRQPAQHIAAAIVTLCLAACSGSSGFTSAESKDDKGSEGTKIVETKDPPAAGSASGEDEASVPLIVAGAYLICADAVVPAGKDAELAVGCSLQNKVDGTHVDFKTITDGAAVWTAGKTERDGVKIAVDVPAAPAATDPQALFLFTGADASVRRAVADETEVRLDVTLRQPVAGFEGYSVAIKDAKAGEANKTSTSAAAAGGPVTPAERGETPGDQGIIVADDPSLPPTGDFDNDTVNNADDRCDNTPPGSNIWTAAKVTASGNDANTKWIGCSGGQFSSGDDTDLDGIANIYDKCPATTKGATDVETAVGSAQRGCAPGESPTASGSGG